MDLESIKVRIPSEVIFLCGGAEEKDRSKPPLCLRDVFNRCIETLPHDYEIILAEAAEPLTSNAGYGDLLSFESDIAQIVGVILLFAESPGSLAELGAFSAIETIAPSLLAVVNDSHYDRESFIRRGPIQHLEREYGDESIFVLPTKELNFGPNGEIDDIDTVSFMDNIVPALESRLSKRQFYSRLDTDSSGHRILMLVGLCQEYGALTITELKTYFGMFGISPKDISRYIYCAKLFKWIDEVRKGHHIFFVARVQKSVLEYSLKNGVLPRDALRWRLSIRDHWKIKDRSRHNAIVDVVAPGSRVR